MSTPYPPNIQDLRDLAKVLTVLDALEGSKLNNRDELKACIRYLNTLMGVYE